MIFCAGACSHLDTFDFKPGLIKYHDQPMPGSEKIITFQGGKGRYRRVLGSFGQEGNVASRYRIWSGSLVNLRMTCVFCIR